MEVAVTLVEFEENDEHSLKVSDEALREIKNIPTTYGIKTVAIVGPGRTGKSSLLNWLVGKKVFETGSKTERVTKDIWMFIDQDDDKQLAIIYLDVEGFGDPSKSNVNENDTRLLNIVTQICDVVLYNIKGVYDSDMRDKIQIVCNLFQRYRKMNAVLEKPILVSLLRDFDLDPPNCPDTEFRDLFKRSPNLLKTFRETKAFTLLKPSEGKVGDLTYMPDEKLCEDFVRVRNELKAYLTAKTKPLSATPHQKMTGIVLAENIKRTVQYINDDDLRMLSKSLPTIFKEKNDAMTGSALDTYRTEMCKNWPLPSQPETLMQLHDRTKKVALEYIDRYCFIIEGSVEIDKEAFTIDIENIFKDIQKDKCKDALLSAICDIENKLKRKVYYEIGGLKLLFKDYDEAEKAYKEMKNLGPEKLSVWEAYNKEMDTIKDLIKEKARLIEREHYTAALQMENRELIERLEMDRKAFEAKLKELQNKESNDNLRKWVLGITELVLNRSDLVGQCYRFFQEAVASSETSGARSSSPVDGARSSTPDGSRSSSPDLSFQDTEV